MVAPDVEIDYLVATRCRKKCRTRLVRVPHHGHTPWGLVEYYYNLACFYKSRGDLAAAGDALGRALHYLHDTAVKTRKWLILDVHDEVEREMEKLASSLPEVCRGVEGKKSTDAREALCLAYNRTLGLVAQFLQERLPTAEEARRLLKRGRLKKAAVFSAAWGAAAVLYATTPLSVLALVGAAVASFLLAGWTPREYILAMRGGATVVRPYGYRPAL